MIYNLHDIFGFIIVLIGLLGMGSFFVKKDFFSYFIAGLVVLASIISPLSYYDVSKAKYVVWFFILLGVIRANFWIYKNYKSILVKANLIFYFKFILFFIFFLILFRSLHYQNYIFDTHDLLYFSWAPELITAEYSGPIRLSVSWPNEMAANHLLPGSMLASIGIFISKPSMLSIIEIRYLLICAAFANFTQFLLSRYGYSILRVLLLFMIFFIFADAILTEVTISSFAYIIVLFEVLKKIFNDNINDNDLIFFGVMLIIAKAPIFLIASVMVVWFILKKGIKNLDLCIYYAIFLVLINILTWALVQSPSGTDTSFRLALPYDVRSMLGLTSLPSWALENTITIFLRSCFEMPFLIIIITMYIFIKYYYLYFWVRDKKLIFANTSKNDFDNNTKIKGLDIYFLVSLFSFVFIRNGWEIGHQAHAILLSSVIIITILFLHLGKKITKFKFSLITLIFIIHTVHLNPVDLFSKYMQNKSNNYTSVKFTEIYNSLKFTSSNSIFYTPTVDEKVSISQIKSALLGLKLDSKKYSSPLEKNQITRWIIWKK